MEYLPRFRKHPTHPKEYATLITLRGVAVGRLMWFLDYEISTMSKAKGDVIYNKHITEYRAIIRQIQAMEDLSNFIGININEYLNNQY
jgi:hypothetical protein